MVPLATTPAWIHPTEPIAPKIDKTSGEAKKLQESCRQFEAVIWRSVLEKSSAPLDEGASKESGGDKTGTYQYFVNDTIANSVTGLPSSFSSILFAALSPHLPQDFQPTSKS